MDIFTHRFMGPLGPWSADQVTVAIVAAVSLVR